MRKDPVRLLTHLVVYVVLFIVGAMMFGWALANFGYMVGMIGTSLAAAAFANWLALRIFEGRHLLDAGLWWNRASWDNLIIGLIGGAGAAAVVLAPPLLFRAAHLAATPVEAPTFGSFVFVMLLLLAGVLGEELLFRGYGFQILLASAGPYAAILPVGVVFALLHGSNPNATWFGLANTAGFGILFGYAYVRSRDLWLPVGLHFGWNVTLPLFGVNLSGLRMKLSGFEMAWTAGPVWSGGAYGPEASVLTTGAMVLLAVYLWKAPIRRQCSPITDPPVESPICEPSRPLPS
jgi:membrane protease YdiL (CAAX protease family)